MASPTRKISFASDPLLLVSAWMSTLVFGLFSLALVSALASGIKPSEVLVVSLYTGGCVTAFIASILLTTRSYRWALLVCLGALVAAIGGYAFEPDFQDEAAYGIAMVLIGGPVLLALLVGGGYLRAAKRRANLLEVPSARAMDA